MYTKIEAFPGGIYPGKETPTAKRTNSTFRTPYEKTRKMLCEEVRRIQLRSDSDEIVIRVGYHPDDLKKDGSGPKANAKPFHPGVAVRFQRDGKWAEFCVDQFYAYQSLAWRKNLHAVVLGLENLRGLERWGMGGEGQQYVGFMELGAGSISLGAATMTIGESADWLATIVGDGRVFDSANFNAASLSEGYKHAAKHLHPDQGGSASAWQTLQDAYQVLRKAITG